MPSILSFFVEGGMGERLLLEKGVIKNFNCQTGDSLERGLIREGTY